MSKWSTQVMRDGICESFQFFVYGLKFTRTSGELVIQRADVFIPVFALGDIADRARDQRALLRLQWTEADLHRKFRSVFSQPIQLQTLAHRSHARLGEVPGAVFRMSRTKPFRNQNLNLPLQEF